MVSHALSDHARTGPSLRSLPRPHGHTMSATSVILPGRTSNISFLPEVNKLAGPQIWFSCTGSDKRQSGTESLVECYSLREKRMAQGWQSQGVPVGAWSRGWLTAGPPRPQQGRAVSLLHLQRAAVAGQGQGQPWEFQLWPFLSTVFPLRL